MNARPNQRTSSRTRLGFTLVESLISVVVVGVMLVAALSTVAVASRAEYQSSERRKGLALAQMLMAEILQQAYGDPAYPPGSWGLGEDEKTGDRSRFDDVDDYDRWEAEPPQNKDGSVIGWARDYAQAVSVAWADPNAPAVLRGSETGLKRIQVTIRHAGRTVARLTGYRSWAWANPADLQGAPP